MATPTSSNAGPVTVPELHVIDGKAYADSWDLAQTFGVDHAALMALLAVMRSQFPQAGIEAHFRDRQCIASGELRASVLLSETAFLTLFETMDRLRANMGTFH